MTEIGQHVWLRFGTGCPRRLFAFYLWQFTTTRRPKPTLLSARVTPNLFIISTHYIPNDQMTCKPPSRKTPVFHFMGQFRLWELRWCIRLDSETKSSPSEQPSQGGTTDNTHVDTIANPVQISSWTAAPGRTKLFSQLEHPCFSSLELQVLPALT